MSLFEISLLANLSVRESLFRESRTFRIPSFKIPRFTEAVAIVG